MEKQKSLRVAAARDHIKTQRVRWAAPVLLTRQFIVSLVEELNDVDELRPTFSNDFEECLLKGRSRTERSSLSGSNSRAVSPNSGDRTMAPPQPTLHESSALATSLGSAIVPQSLGGFSSANTSQVNLKGSAAIAGSQMTGKRKPAKYVNKFKADVELGVDDFVLRMLQRLHQLHIINYTIPRAWDYDPCSHLDPDYESEEVIFAEQLCRWKTNISVKWRQTSPIGINGQLEYFSDINVLQYCLMDVFECIDSDGKGEIGWMQFVTFVADSSSVAVDQRAVPQIQLLMAPEVSYTKDVARTSFMKPWPGRHEVYSLMTNRKGSNSISVLDATTFKETRSFQIGSKGDRGSVVCLELIPKYDMIACGAFDGVRLYDATNWVNKAVLKDDDSVMVVRWVGSANRLVTGTRTGNVRLYDLSRVDKTFYQTNKPVTDVPFVSRKHHDESVTDILPETPTNSIVSSGMDGTISFSHVESTFVRKLSGAIIFGMQLVSKHGMILAYGVDPVPIVWLYNVVDAVPTPMSLRGTTPHLDRIVGIRLLSDENYAVSMDRKGIVKVWIVWEQICVQTLSITEGDVDGAFLKFGDFFYSKEQRHLLTSSKNKTFRLSYNDQGERNNVRLASFDPIVALVFLQDLNTLITASKNNLVFWNIATLRPMYTFEAVTKDDICALAACVQTRLLFVGSATGTVLTLSLGNLSQRHSWQHPGSKPISKLVFVAKGRSLVAVAGKEAYSIVGNSSKPFRTSASINLDVSTVEYHQHAKLLVVGEESAAISIWRLLGDTDPRWFRAAQISAEASPLGITCCPQTSSFFVYDTLGMIYLFDIARIKEASVSIGGEATRLKRRQSSVTIKQGGKRLSRSPSTSPERTPGSSQSQRVDQKQKEMDLEDVFVLLLATRWVHRRRHSSYSSPVCGMALMEDKYDFLYVVDELGFATIYDIRQAATDDWRLKSEKTARELSNAEAIRQLSPEAAMGMSFQMSIQRGGSISARSDSSDTGDRSGERRLSGDTDPRTPQTESFVPTRSPSIAADPLTPLVPELSPSTDTPVQPPSVSLVPLPQVIIEQQREHRREQARASRASITGFIPGNIRKRLASVSLETNREPSTTKFRVVVLPRRSSSEIEIFNVKASPVHAENVTGLLYLSTPSVLVTACRDGNVFFWSLYLEKNVASLSLGDKNARNNALFVAPPPPEHDVGAIKPSATVPTSPSNSDIGSSPSQANDSIALSPRAVPPVELTPTPFANELHASHSNETMQFNDDFLDDVPFPYNASKDAEVTSMSVWERRNVAPILCTDALMDDEETEKLIQDGGADSSGSSGDDFDLASQISSAESSMSLSLTSPTFMTAGDDLLSSDAKAMKFANSTAAMLRKKKRKKMITAKTVGMSEQQQIMIYKDWVHQQEEKLRKRRGVEERVYEQGDPRAPEDIVYATMVIKKKKQAQKRKNETLGAIIDRDLTSERKRWVPKVTPKEEPLAVNLAKDRLALFKLHTKKVTDVVEDFLNDPKNTKTNEKGRVVSAIDPKHMEKMSFHPPTPREDALPPIKGVSELVTAAPERVERVKPEEVLLDRVKHINEDRSGLFGVTSAQKASLRNKDGMKCPPQATTSLDEIKRRTALLKARWDFKQRIHEENRMTDEEKDSRKETLEHMAHTKFMKKLEDKWVDNESLKVTDRRNETATRSFAATANSRSLWRQPEEKLPEVKIGRAVGGSKTTKRLPRYAIDRSKSTELVRPQPKGKLARSTSALDGDSLRQVEMVRTAQLFGR